MTKKPPRVIAVNAYFHRIRKVWIANARDVTGTEVEFYVMPSREAAVEKCKTLCDKYPTATYRRQ